MVIGIILMARDGRDGKLEKVTEEKAGEIMQRILDLAETRDHADGEVVGAIKRELDKLEGTRYFTDVFYEVDPGSGTSSTKRLEDYARDRLDTATSEYVDEHKG